MTRPTLWLLIALVGALSATTGCSCSGKPESADKLVKRPHAKPSIASALMVYLDERKALQGRKHDAEVAAIVDVQKVDPKTLESIGGDVEFHESLKTACGLFSEKRYPEALAEFRRVAEQYPDDKGLLVVAEKNIAITCLALGRRDDYLTHVSKYAEMLGEYLDATDADEIKQNED